jgi:hypothetical protein
MKVRIKPTAYSSIVGGGLTIYDESGRARFLMSLMGTTEGITREENNAIADAIVQAFDDKTIEVPDRLPLETKRST